MDELIRDQTIWTGRYVDAHVDEAVAWSKKTYNVEVITFDSDNKQKMHELLSPLVENYISRVEPQVPGKKIIEDIAALMEKYAPQYQ
jgi:hypothetical protein